MTTSRYLRYAGAVAAVLVLTLIASFVVLDRSQVAGSPTPTTTLAPTATTTSPIASASSTPTTTPVSAISGGLGYPSDHVPPLTVYAISVADQRIFFSVDTPRYGAGSSAPNAPANYTITGVAPGTYYVLGYRNDDVNIEAKNRPGLYAVRVEVHSRERVGSDSTAGLRSPGRPLTCAGHGPARRDGEPVSRIDVKDWYYLQATYPPRPR